MQSGFDALREAAGKSIDMLMDRASQKLVETDYFGTQELCLRAMEKCRRSRDWERLARIILPLQESRRQLRHLACDTGKSFIVHKMPTRAEGFATGCYLLEPPLVGIDGRNFRELLRAKRVPALVLTKEPTTASGKWPIAGAGDGHFEVVVARVQVDPPAGFKGAPARLTNMSHGANIDPSWFLATQEALGDAAIRKVRHEWPASHRVEDLLELLDAVPDHEKLAQAVALAAREAMAAPAPAMPRRRPWREEPFSF